LFLLVGRLTSTLMWPREHPATIQIRRNFFSSQKS